MKFEMDEQTLNNLVAFLNRVEYRGLQEVQAINQIMEILSNPEKKEE